MLQVKILQKGRCALVFRGLSWHRGRKKLEVCGCLHRPSDNEIYVTQTLVDPRGLFALADTKSINSVCGWWQSGLDMISMVA